jgi:hypothetical protein
MELDGNSSAKTSAAFLQQVRAHHPEPLIVIWDNSPAHSGDPLRADLTTAGRVLATVLVVKGFERDVFAALVDRWR